MKNNLFAGYWLGEFGHELFSWQARLRYISERYDKITIGCQKGHEYLYRDFANDFVYPDQNYIINNKNMWSYNSGNLYGFEVDCDRSQATEIISPSKSYCSQSGAGDSKYVRYGERGLDKGFRVLLHARNTDNYQTGYRNWPVKNWNSIVSELGNQLIASVGKSGEALHVEGTENLLDLPLSELCDVMANSSVLVSPSSGPAHLASLCGLTHIVWSDKSRTAKIMDNESRYKKIWNPFMTSCVFIPTWQPTPGMVLNWLEVVLS